MFFEESNEHLADMESALLELENNPTDSELLNRVFRGAHSIKGAAGSLGFAELAQFTHVLENLLDRLREAGTAPSRSHSDLLLRSTDVLRGLVMAALSGSPAPSNTAAVLEAIQDNLDAESVSFHDGTDATELGADGTGYSRTRYSVTFAPYSDAPWFGPDPVLLFRHLHELGIVESVEVDTSALPPLDQLDPERCYLRFSAVLETLASRAEVEEVFAFVLDAAQVQIEVLEACSTVGAPLPPEPVSDAAPAAAAGPIVASPAVSLQNTPPADKPLAQPTKTPGPESATLRIAASKVDKLIDLVGEVIIAQSMVSQEIRNFSIERLQRLREAITEMERNTRELQEQIMGVRMVPVANLFSRFPRVVRDTAAELNKTVQLVTAGEETELDKTVIDGLVDPLMHLVRNALDHGIETPDARTSLGKPAQATLKIEAMHEGGSVVIVVRDDGRGLDTDRIWRKAVERGLVRPDEKLTEEQVHALIFKPGFSTADTVSKLSGRGVGLDVVRKNVENLNGTIALSSEPNRGTAFRIKLPLTLAILDGLALRISNQVFIVPLASVLESLRPTPAQLQTLVGVGQVVVIRGEPVPLIQMSDFLSITEARTARNGGIAVIVEHDNKKAAMWVDEVLGQSQVVIKSVESNFRRIDGIVGATVLGDGRVALILDVQAVVRGDAARLDGPIIAGESGLFAFA
jgi:two-component system chemotaxis sensor kinase CheA